MRSRGKRAFVTESPAYQEQQPCDYPIYPFNIDFTANKQKPSSILPLPPLYFPEQTSPIVTDIEQSEDYFDEEFQSYSSVHTPEEESIVDDIDGPMLDDDFLAEQDNNKLAETASNHDAERYWDFSQSVLRKMNEKMVHLKEQFRRIARKYTHNASILAQQRAQLQKLRSQKKKALDYDYELELSRQEGKKRVQSQVVSGTISKAVTIIKKLRYKRIKEGKTNPFDISCQLIDSRIIDDQSPEMSKLQSTRQEVLCKMRQQQNNSELLQALQQKQQEYLKLIDAQNGHLCKGDLKNLNKRVQFLKKELQIKKDVSRLKEEEKKLEITALKNQLITYDFRIERAQRDLRQLLIQVEDRKQHVAKSKVKPNIFVHNKKSSHLMKMLNPISPKSFTEDSYGCTPTTHSKVKISFDQSVVATPQQYRKKRGVKNSYYRQHTTHQ